jgi:hypothetical protein
MDGSIESSRGNDEVDFSFSSDDGSSKGGGRVGDRFLVVGRNLNRKETAFLFGGGNELAKRPPQMHIRYMPVTPDRQLDAKVK